MEGQIAIFSHPVLVMVSIAMMKTHDEKSSRGEKGFIWLLFLHYSPSLKLVKTETPEGTGDYCFPACSI